MKIKAALLTQANTPFVIEELDLQDPQAGEVLVKLTASGVCHSDYHLVTGDTKHPMPVVAGHEGAGVVEAVGAGVTRVKVGDHVVLSWTPDCGECHYCRKGKPNLCETFTGPIWNGVMLDGTPRLSWKGKPVYHYCGTACFAEYTVVPQQSCVPVRADAPLQIASLIGCAVATGVGSVIYTAGVKPGESVAVYGCGGIGLNILQGAVLSGAHPIIAVDTNETKLQIARDFGATHAILANAQTADKIRELTSGRGADQVFEAVGTPAVQEASLEAVAPGGTLTLVGLSAMGTGTNFPGALLVRQEKTVKGSYYGTVSPQRDFPLFLDLYMAGRLQLDQLVTRQYKLEQINEAYEDMLSGESARGVIVF
jgi:S-(hydroxymethyl)glutathione dehydrogenase / alcohol dehydrogenase